MSKRYTLPTIVLDSLINYFCKTGMDRDRNEEDDGEIDRPDDGLDETEIDDAPKEMPVMWHQTVLTLVQCYKSYFSADQRKKILALVKVQNHYAITPEIRREL